MNSKGSFHSKPHEPLDLHHEHASDDTMQRRDVLRRLRIAMTICSFFFVLEVIGGYLAGSLAVISDAAHLFADLTAFAVALVANHVASMPSTAQHTYGLKRTESLAALFSMISLAIVCAGLAVEAVHRLYRIVGLWWTNENLSESSIYEVNGPLMSLIASIGVLVNLVLAYVLGEDHVHLPGTHGGDHGHCGSHDHSHEHSHQHADEPGSGVAETDALVSAESGDYGTNKLEVLHSDEVHSPHLHPEKKHRNVNIHAAYLHVLGDLAQSVAVLIAGLIIWFKPAWIIVDPIVTLGFCMMVFYSTLGVFRSSIAVLMEEVPPNIDWNEVHDDLEAVPELIQIHDLHIWLISDGVPCASMHATAVDDKVSAALHRVTNIFMKHGIKHTTAQIQPASAGPWCITCSNLRKSGKSEQGVKQCASRSSHGEYCTPAVRSDSAAGHE